MTKDYLPKHASHHRRRKTKRANSRPSSNKKVSALGVLISRFFVIILALVLLIVVGFGMIWALSASFLPLTRNQNILFVSSSLESQTRQIYFASFSAENHSITVVPLEDTEAMVLGGYGNYRLSAIAALLALEKKSPAFTQAAFNWATQILVDEVVPIGSETITLNTPAQLTARLLTELQHHWYQPKRFISLLRLALFAKSVADEQYSVEANPIAIAELSGYLSETQTASCTVAVVNTTDKSGLATVVARILDHTKLSIIRVTDDPLKFEKSKISVSTEKNHPCLQIAQRITHIFPNGVELTNDEAVRKEHRADIVVQLGNDLSAVAAW